jgi:hypothetical protein
MLQPATETSVKLRSSCDACLRAKVKCSQDKLSCARCIQHGRKCVYSQYRKIGRPSTKASAATTPQQLGPHTARNTDRKAQQQPTPQTSARSQVAPQHQVRVRLDTHPTHSVEPNFIRITPNHFLDSNTAQSPTSSTELLSSKLVTNETTSLLGGRYVPPVDQNTPGSELMAAFTNEMLLEDINWADLGEFFDGETMVHTIGHQAQTFEAHNRGPYGRNSGLSNVFAGRMSPSCSKSGSQSFPSEANFSTLYRPPTSPIEQLLSPHTSFFSDGTTSFSPSSPASEPSRTAPALNCVFPPSTTSTRPSTSGLFSNSQTPHCTLQCQAILTAQLGDIAKYQVKDAVVALDVLLNLNDHVRTASNTVMRCAYCLAGNGTGQIFILISMVIGNLLGLFESSCGAFAGDGSVEGRSKVYATPDSKESPYTSRPSLFCNPLPSSSGPLIVGNTVLSESIKIAFSRRLVLMYAERQLGLVQSLQQMLLISEEGAEEGTGVSFKVTRELLSDVKRRLERLMGFVSLLEAVEIESLVV